MKKIFYLLFAVLLVSSLAGCSDDDDTQPLALETYEVSVNFGETKYVAVTNWVGDKAAITVATDNDRLVDVDMVDAKEGEEPAGNSVYVRILGIGDGQASVIVKDEKGNQAIVTVKASDPLAGFKDDDTVQLLLDDDVYKINLREGDSNGGEYLFGRLDNTVIFRWDGTDGKSASIVYTDESANQDFSFGVKTDAVLTLVNPAADIPQEVINLPWLRVISSRGTLGEPGADGISPFIPNKAWILFRLPARAGQEQGTMGYCVGAVTPIR